MRFRLIVGLSLAVFALGCSSKPNKRQAAAPTSAGNNSVPGNSPVPGGDSSSVETGDDDAPESNTKPGQTPSDPGPSNSDSPNSNSVTALNCYKGDEFVCAVEAAIVAEMNTLRSTPLPQSAEVSFIARQWSIEQANRNKIGHDGFPAVRQSALAAEFPNVKLRFRAENVAMTGGSTADAAKLAKTFVTMWYNSEGHRKNMLGNHKGIGVGVSRNGRNAYATQIFY